MKKNIVKIITFPIITTYGIYYYFYFNYIKNNNIDIYKFI